MADSVNCVYEGCLYPGILSDITMAVKLMYIPNDETQIYPFVETFGHSTESTNQSKSNKSFQSFGVDDWELYYRTLGTSVITASLSGLNHPVENCGSMWR